MFRTLLKPQIYYLTRSKPISRLPLHFSVIGTPTELRRMSMMTRMFSTRNDNIETAGFDDDLADDDSRLLS